MKLIVSSILCTVFNAMNYIALNTVHKHCVKKSTFYLIFVTLPEMLVHKSSKAFFKPEVPVPSVLPVA